MILTLKPRSSQRGVNQTVHWLCAGSQWRLSGTSQRTRSKGQTQTGLCRFYSPILVLHISIKLRCPEFPRRLLRSFSSVLFDSQPAIAWPSSAHPRRDRRRARSFIAEQLGESCARRRHCPSRCDHRSRIGSALPSIWRCILGLRRLVTWQILGCGPGSDPLAFQRGCGGRGHGAQAPDCADVSAAPDRKATVSRVSARSEVTQPGS